MSSESGMKTQYWQRELEKICSFDLRNIMIGIVRTSLKLLNIVSTMQFSLCEFYSLFRNGTALSRNSFSYTLCEQGALNNFLIMKLCCMLISFLLMKHCILKGGWFTFAFVCYVRNVSRKWRVGCPLIVLFFHFCSEKNLWQQLNV
jgi:hypothetical protein